MKTRSIIFLLLIMFSLSSCVVKSLHQFYHDEDVVFEEALLGSWIDADGSRWVIKPFTFSKGFMQGDSTDNSYLVELYEDSGDVQQFNVHLFKLKGRMYLDFYPILNERQDDFLHIHLVPAHSLALVERNGLGGWTIGWFNAEWLEKLFKENRVKISHEFVKGGHAGQGDQYVLTASTGELQKFIEKYGFADEKGLCKDEENFLCVELKRNDE